MAGASTGPVGKGEVMVHRHWTRHPRGWAGGAILLALVLALGSFGLPTTPARADTTAIPAWCHGKTPPEKPTKVEKTRSGGKKFSFNVDNREHDSYVPPDGFDPLTATDAQLAEYSFPARPTSGSKLDHWKQVMAKAKRAVPTPSICKKEQTESTATVNWSGYRSDAQNQPDGATTPYYGVDGLYQQAYYQSACSPSAKESSWVGMDSWDNTTLTQAGTMIEAGKSQPYSAFYEVYSSNNRWSFGFYADVPVNPGDNMYVDVTYFSPNLGSGDLTKYYYEYFVENTTQGMYSIYTVTAPPIYGYFRWADAIDERPNAVGSTQSVPLLNFHAVYWEFVDDVRSSGQSRSFWDSWAQAQAMWNGTHALANPSGLFSPGTLFADYWDACL
jgi:hypothetical protein